MDQLQIALADLVFTTTLLQEVDLCPLGAGLVSIEDGGHWGQPLARSLSPEPWSLEIVGQSHHNGPKLVFDILL